MADYDNNKDLQLNQILHVVKIAALFFSAVAFFQYQSSIGKADSLISNTIMLAGSLLIVLIIYCYGIIIRRE
jgi:hypothetical protein